MAMLTGGWAVRCVPDQYSAMEMPGITVVPDTGVRSGGCVAGNLGTPWALLLLLPACFLRRQW